MKRILYVDRDLRYSGTVIFAEGLQALGDVSLMESLSWEVVEAVRRAVAEGRPFDAVVSHLPQTGSPMGYPNTSCPGGALMLKHAVYGAAFSLLGLIKEVADIPVMVYTGAGEMDIPAVSWELSGADDVVHKSRDPEDDARRVVTAIHEAWAQYAALPAAADSSCVSDAEFTWVETPIRLNWGVGMAAAAKMAKILSGFKWRAERFDDGTRSGVTWADDIMGVMTLEAVCGTRLRVRVNAVTQEAQDALCKAHRLLNARYLGQEL